MKKYFVLMVLGLLYNGAIGQGNYYQFYNVTISFDGQKREITRHYVLRITEDVAITDYRYNMINVPYEGGIDDAKITVSINNKQIKKYNLKDATIKTHDEDYILISDNKCYYWDLGKLSPGSDIEYTFKTYDKQASYGDYEAIMSELPVKQAQIKVIFPASKWRLKYSVDNKAPVVIDNNAEQVFIWNDLPSQKDSDYKEAPNDVLPGLWYLFESKEGQQDYSIWNGVNRWYWDLCKTDADLKNRESLLRIARTPGEIVASINSECRYVAVEIGKQKFKPEMPDMVWRNRFGDCKGLANLFVSWMKAAGYQAWPVLVLSSDEMLGNSSFPSPYQFNHHIAAYIDSSGDTCYQDLTASYCPIGNLPRSLYGCFALPLIENTNPIRLDCFPKNPDTINISVSGELTDNNILQGNITLKEIGLPALSWNREIKSTKEVNKIDSYNHWLENIFPGARFKNITEKVADNDIIEIAATVTKTNFGYQKSDSIIIRPWILNFVSYDKNTDTNRTWPTILNRNIVFHSSFRCRVPDSKYIHSAINCSSEIPQWISCHTSNESLDDSLITDLTQRYFSAIIQPGDYSTYNNKRYEMAVALKRGIVFLKNGQK